MASNESYASGANGSGTAPARRPAPAVPDPDGPPEHLTQAQIRAILRRRRVFPKRRCQCCGRLYKPQGRWNCRCEECHLVQDEEQPARVFPDQPPQRKRKELAI